MMTGDWWGAHAIVDVMRNGRWSGGWWRKVLDHLTNGRVITPFTTAVGGGGGGGSAFRTGTTIAEAEGARKGGLGKFDKNLKTILLNI